MYLLRLNKEINPIYHIDNFLSDKEIEEIIKYTKSLVSRKAGIGIKNLEEEKEKKIFTPNYHIKDINSEETSEIRKSTIKWITLNSKTNWLYKKIIQQIHKVNQENFNYILKFIEDIQFTEYNENQHGFYAKHYDNCHKNELDSHVDIRKLSFSIQLSDETEYEGCELILYVNEEKIVAPKKKGTIIFFQSDTLHEVTPLKTGNRCSLVGWVSGPNLR